jgi:hypothetical protein
MPAQRDRWGPNRPRPGREDPTNPLHARRSDVIAHYDRHGYPERARYTERQDLLGLIFRRAELHELQGEARREDILAWSRDMFVYWTGWPAESLEDLAIPFCALQYYAERARRVGQDPRASQGDRRHSQELIETARGICRPIADSVTGVGLWARVNNYLTPTGLPTADMLGYALASQLRAVCGSSAPLRVEFPGSDSPAPYVLVCERCSLVHTSTRVASRCRYCAKRNALPDGAVRVPTTHPDLSWLVIGDRVAHLRRCEECDETFTTLRASARTCSVRCRVARSRRQSM